MRRRTSLLAAALIAGTMPAAGEAEEHPGERHYRRICFICHDRDAQVSASRGAPRLGDLRAWESRRAKGINALYASVLKKKVSDFAMPTADLTEAEIRAAIDYMLDQVEPPRLGAASEAGDAR